MAKPSKEESLTRWREAETKYRKLVESYLEEGTAAKFDKGSAVLITKARVKADQRRDAYFHRCLG